MNQSLAVVIRAPAIYFYDAVDAHTVMVYIVSVGYQCIVEILGARISNESVINSMEKDAIQFGVGT